MFSGATALTRSPRIPTLAGMFYPSQSRELKNLLASFFNGTVTSVTRPKGILVPHAGFIYSGHASAVSYAKIDPSFIGTFVIIGPSHSGHPTATADFAWETPIGTVYPDSEFIEELPLLKDEAILRDRENSLEVQMPFIAYRFPNAKIVPVLIGDQSVNGAKTVASAVLQAITSTGRNVIIIASSDGSHYVPRKVAECADLAVLAALKNLDVSAFYEKLKEIRPSMCGYGGVAAMAEICAGLDAKEARVLCYTTSGDATGCYDKVVGYAAMEML
ncbi:MAG TPA: AmmeMemoRadiSam system protein B [Methanocorpusculum sp.]|nr:AmmeMemoRadiSam system protein B [Methanocorpusculum sp.]